MKSSELKQAINEDIETIKNLDLDIMESKEYYHLHRFLFTKVFLIYYFIAFVSCFLFTLTSINLVMIAIPIIPSLFIFSMHLSTLNDYIIFNYQIRPKLKTGNLIVQKLKKAIRLYFFLYIPVVWSAAFLCGHIFILIFGPPHFEGEPYFKLIISCAFPFGGFIFCMLIVQSIIELELKRVGISTLFAIIQKYFNQNDEEKIKNITWSKK